MLRGNTKERIFKEAVRLFSEQSYAETTIRDISSAVNINEATIYIYFKSKSEILNEILDGFEDKLDRCFFARKYINARLDADALQKLLHRLLWNSMLENDIFMRHVFRIVCMEQYINSKAGTIVTVMLHDEVAWGLREVLDKLIELREFPDFDTYTFAELWAHIMFSSAVIATYKPSAEAWNNLREINEILLKMAASGKIPNYGEKPTRDQTNGKIGSLAR